MALAASQVSVTTTATPLEQSDADGISVLVRNTHATTSVFLGGVGVTTTTGYELLAGGAASINLFPGETLYGVAATGTARIDTLANRKPG